MQIDSANIKSLNCIFYKNVLITRYLFQVYAFILSYKLSLALIMKSSIRLQRFCKTCTTTCGNFIERKN